MLMIKHSGLSTVSKEKGSHKCFILNCHRPNGSNPNLGPKHDLLWILSLASSFCAAGRTWERSVSHSKQVPNIQGQDSTFTCLLPLLTINASICLRSAVPSGIQALLKLQRLPCLVAWGAASSAVPKELWLNTVQRAITFFLWSRIAQWAHRSHSSGYILACADCVLCGCFCFAGHSYVISDKRTNSQTKNHTVATAPTEAALHQ